MIGILQRTLYGAGVVSLVMSSIAARADQTTRPAPANPRVAAIPLVSGANDELQPPPVPAQTPPPGEPAQTPPPRGQQPPRTPTAAPPAASAPRVEGQPLNVRIDLTISDEGAGASPVKKIVSMTVGDREYGQIRSEAFITLSTPGPMMNQSVPLHVDAQPVVLPDGKVRLRLTLNYNVTFAAGGKPPTREDVVNSLKTEIREQLGFILESGKPMIVSQSADPIGDRRLVVEVKATVLR